jgi:hypothetical protein
MVGCSMQSPRQAASSDRNLGSTDRWHDLSRMERGHGFAEDHDNGARGGSCCHKRFEVQIPFVVSEPKLAVTSSAAVKMAPPGAPDVVKPFLPSRALDVAGLTRQLSRNAALPHDASDFQDVSGSSKAACLDQKDLQSRPKHMDATARQITASQYASGLTFTILNTFDHSWRPSMTDRSDPDTSLRQISRSYRFKIPTCCRRP